MEIGEARKALLDELRQYAKEIYLEDQDRFQRRSAAEIKRLIHSLATELGHLEKQNEELRQVHTDLEEERSRYASLFDFAPVAYFDLDKDCIIMKANFLAGTLLGISRSQLVGMDFTDFISTPHQPTFISCCGEMAREGTIQKLEVEMVRKDGTTFYAQLQLLTIPGKSGIIFRVSAQDTTETTLAKKALEESERRFRSTLDNMREGCIIIDHDFRYLYANEASVRFARRTREQRLGHTIMEVLPGFEKTEAFARLKRCMDGRVPDEYEVEYTFPEGVTAWFEVRCEPVPDGLLVLYLDITERKQKELAGAAA